MNIDKNASVVDVRTPSEYAGEHYHGAFNIPLNELPNRIEECKALPKPIIAYCRTGSRSRTAVALLKQNGISEAVNGGGLADMLQSIHY